MNTPPEVLDLSSPQTYLKHQLIVSVQADEGEPLNTPTILGALGESVLSGGAAALRMANANNIQTMKARRPDCPIIGITKPPRLPASYLDEVYITPTWEDITSLVHAGSDVVAMDATHRTRPGEEVLAHLVQQAHQQHPETLLMADIATLDEGMAAVDLGFHWISTTLSGYTRETAHRNNGQPDFDLLTALTQHLSCPIILEGRVWEPPQVAEAFKRGAHAVVIGSSITRPHLITRWFHQHLPQPEEKQ